MRCEALGKNHSYLLHNGRRARTPCLESPLFLYTPGCTSCKLPYCPGDFHVTGAGIPVVRCELNPSGRGSSFYLTSKRYHTLIQSGSRAEGYWPGPGCSKAGPR